LSSSSVYSAAAASASSPGSPIGSGLLLPRTRLGTGSLLTLLVGHLTSGGGTGVVFELEGVLQDDHGRLGIDDLSPLTRGLPGRGQGMVGFDGREPFVDQPDRGSGGRADPASEFQCRRGRGACGP